MKANKRVRDLKRRSLRRLVSSGRNSVGIGTTTFPLCRKQKDGSQVRNGVKLEWI